MDGEDNPRGAVRHPWGDPAIQRGVEGIDLAIRNGAQCRRSLFDPTLGPDERAVEEHAGGARPR
jgi:hypothetical protein